MKGGQVRESDTPKTFARQVLNKRLERECTCADIRQKQRHYEKENQFKTFEAFEM